MNNNFRSWFQIKNTWLIIVGLLGLFFVIQVFYLYVSKGRINCDDALTGLAALHILRGERPIFLPGQVYGGTLKAYLVAFFFKVFGASPFVLLFTCTLFAAGFIVTTYYLGCLLFSAAAGLAAAAYLVIAPAAFMGYSHSAIGTYIENIFLGNLILILTYQLVKKTGWQKLIFWLELSFLAGLAWWVSYAVIYYLVTALVFIYLKDRISFLRKNFYFGLVAFFAGSLPYWIFNFRHRWLTFSKMANPLAGLSVLFSNIAAYFTQLLPKVLGLVDPGFPILAPLVGIFYAIVFLFFLKVYLKDWNLFFCRSVEEVPAPLMLVVLFLVISVIFCFSPYGQKEVVRFILPLYSVFPLVIGWGLSRIYRHNKLVAVFAFTAVLLVGINQNFSMFSNSLKKNGEAFAGEKQLIKFLNDNGLNRCYVVKDIGQIITFKTEEKIICASNEVEVYPPYSLAVDAAERVAFIFMDDVAKKGEVFEAALWAAGGHFRKEQIGLLFTVYYDFQPPADNYEQIPVLVKGVRASVNQAGAFAVVDRNGTTVWEPHKNKMELGEEIIVDIGSLQPVGKIVILPAEFKKEKYSGYPLGFKMLFSADGKNWQELTKIDHYQGTLFWEGGRPFYKVPNGRIEVRFSPVGMRFFKFVQTGHHNRYGWGINEIYFFEPVLPAEEKKYDYPEEAVFLAKFLKTQDLSEVWADFWLNAFLKEKSRGRLKTPETFNELPFDRRFPFAENIWKFTPAEKTALVFKRENISSAKKILFGLSFKRQIIGQWEVLYGFDNAGRKVFFWDGGNVLKYSLGAEN